MLGRTLLTNLLTGFIGVMYFWYAVRIDCVGKTSRHHNQHPKSKSLMLTKEQVQEEDLKLAELDHCFTFACIRSVCSEEAHADNQYLITEPMLHAQRVPTRTTSVAEKIVSALELSPYYADLSTGPEIDLFWGSGLRMWLRITSTWVVVSMMYLFCEAYITFADNQSTYIVPLYLTFTLGLQLMRSLGTLLARNCDLFRYVCCRSFQVSLVHQFYILDVCRHSNVSMEIMVDMAGWSFFYLFYRNLFGLLDAWPAFIEVIMLHRATFGSRINRTCP